jgi:NAD(P)-dependent dehydrogenase (short-subunit alcohol dehydrogenase family)
VRGKTVVITGATSGIGEVAALNLAEKGARIVFIARDKKRADVLLGKFPGGAPHAYHLADLSTIESVKRVGAAIAEAVPKIDVLMNNAGAIFAKRSLTADGLEMTFAVNHMAYFVLTHALLGNVKAAAPGARIISTSSQMHASGRLDFDDLQVKRGYTAWDAYANSKLANVLFTRALAKRLEESGVIANCLHPGFVNTRFGDLSGGAVAPALKLAKLSAIPPARGAETMIWLASSPDAAQYNGRYFDRSKPVTPGAQAQDDAAAERLWIESMRLAGL